MRLVALLVAIAAAPAGLVADTGARESAPAETRAPPEVTCDSRVQVIPRRGPAITRRERRHAVKIGDILFLGARDYSDMRRRTLEARPGRTKPAKVPFLVPSGPAVTLTLAHRSRPRSDIEVGLDQAPYRIRTDAVSLRPCPRDAEVAGRRVGSHTPFNAGFRVSGAQCLRAIVRREGETEASRGRIALGRRTCGW